MRHNTCQLLLIGFLFASLSQSMAHNRMNPSLFTDQSCPDALLIAETLVPTDLKAMGYAGPPEGMEKQREQYENIYNALKAGRHDWRHFFPIAANYPNFVAKMAMLSQRAYIVSYMDDKILQNFALSNIRPLLVVQEYGHKQLLFNTTDFTMDPNLSLVSFATGAYVYEMLKIQSNQKRLEEALAPETIEAFGKFVDSEQPNRREQLWSHIRHFYWILFEKVSLREAYLSLRKDSRHPEIKTEELEELYAVSEFEFQEQLHQFVEEQLGFDVYLIDDIFQTPLPENWRLPKIAIGP